MERVYFSFLALLVLCIFPATLPVANAGQGGRIAVAADGPTADAAVSRQAARCPYFLLFDGQGDLIDSLANPFRQARGGAGPQVADFLAQKGVDTFIAGEFGARMSEALQRKGVAMRIATGIALEAVRQGE